MRHPATFYDKLFKSYGILEISQSGKGLGLIFTNEQRTLPVNVHQWTKDCTESNEASHNALRQAVQKILNIKDQPIRKGRGAYLHQWTKDSLPATNPERDHRTAAWRQTIVTSQGREAREKGEKPERALWHHSVNIPPFILYGGAKTGIMGKPYAWSLRKFRGL